MNTVKYNKKLKEISNKIFNLMIEIKDTIDPNDSELKSILMYLTNVSKEVNNLTIKDITNDSIDIEA